jgi:pimeloyl-ACP methyl ester carboxylesterase
VRALVLADTWAKTGLREADRTLGWALGPLVEASLRLLGTGPLERFTGRHFEPERARERELMVRALAATSRGDAVRVWRGLGEHDTLERLGGLGVPTLLIAGERDASAGQARLMHRLIPGSELAILPGAGHVSNLHRPELFNAALRPFLDRAHATGAPPR